MASTEERSMLAQRALAHVTPSMREIAEEVGVAHSTVRAWSAGHRTPNPGHMVALAGAFEKRCGALQGLAAKLREAAGE